MLYWALLGLVIGVAAAQRKGWSLLAGAVGGALLGPLALLLFFVSGVTRDDKKRKCPHCAEWVQAAAKVCKHCGRTIAALVVAALGVSLVACVPDPPRLEDAVVPTETAAAPAAARARVDSARGEPSAEQVAELEQRLREQGDELTAAQAEVARWRAGLDKCVAKLNEVSADAAAQAAYQPAPEPARRREPARVHTLGAPTISLVDADAFVTVRVWNAGDGDASGEVTLELVCGGRVVDSASQYADITARTDQVVTANLHTIGADGTCSARAHLRF